MIKKGDVVYFTEDAIEKILRHHSDKVCRVDLIKGRVDDIFGDIYKIILTNENFVYHGLINEFIGIRELRIKKIKNLYL